MRASSSGWPNWSSSPVRTPYCGSSPVVNLQIRTCASLSAAGKALESLPPRLVPMTTPVLDSVLDERTWRARAAAHAERVDAFVAPHLARRGSAVKHPVHDFLFSYYSQRPAQLRRWHPGYGVALADAEEYAGLKGYGSDPVAVTLVSVSPEHVASQRPLLVALHRLLT